MRGKERLITFIFTVMASISASQVVNLETFNHVTRLQGTIETAHGISNHVINTLVGCSALCLANGRCWSLFYNFATLACRLNKSPFLVASETTTQQGFHHYSREFCVGEIPVILSTTQVKSFVGTPSITFQCVTNAIHVSGNGAMTCDLNSLRWTMPTLICIDLTPYILKGYTKTCGTESVLKFVGSKVPFDTAKASCGNDQGHLARPRTNIRWTCLADYANSKSSGVHVWMDITDRSVEGTFKFSDNTLVPQPHYWLPGEPYPPVQSTTDCVGIWPNLKQWDDLPCGNVANYMCEIEL